MVVDSLARSFTAPMQAEIAISDSPLNWCSVSLSDVITHGKRLEASVFDVEAKHIWDVVLGNKFGAVPLYGKDGLIELAYYPGWMQRSRLKRIWCERQYGEGFYLPSQMMDIYPSPEKFISRLADCDMNELRLKKNTLLLTRSGTIGNVSYVSKTLEGRVLSDDVMRISFKEKHDLGYVYAFLKSKVGSQILKTNGYGSVITHIEPDHLAEIRVPNAPIAIKSRISELIEHSYALRDESNALIDEATTILIKELELPPIQDFKQNSLPVDAFSVKLSNMKLRLDASYHVPVVDAIIAHLHKHAAEVTAIGDKRISKEVVLPGRFKRVYVDDGFGRVFIGGKQIWELDPTNKKYLSLVHHGDRIAKQLELHENMTLITCSGTIGKVAFVGKHWENWTANQHIIRIVPAGKDIAGYIYIFLSSDYGHQLITHYTYGSVVDEIDDNHVRDISFPILKSQSIQTSINDLALEANAKRYEAYKLEKEAMRIMDEEVIYAK